MSSEEIRKLRRSKSERMLAGVCGGLGDYFKVDPVWFRLGFVFLSLPAGMPGAPVKRSDIFCGKMVIKPSPSSPPSKMVSWTAKGIWPWWVAMSPWNSSFVTSSFNPVGSTSPACSPLSVDPVCRCPSRYGAGNARPRLQRD